jgi:hypothetical protein
MRRKRIDILSLLGMYCNHVCSVKRKTFYPKIHSGDGVPPALGPDRAKVYLYMGE